LRQAQREAVARVK
jgi:DNA-directed RNA polymerase specialized sigma24 family protein